MSYESERQTRKQRIDPKLASAGWAIVPHVESRPHSDDTADYAFFVDGQLLGLVEAKKLTLGPQNVLTQAERYSRGVADSPFNFAGLRVPFLYSTGEVLWHRDGDPLKEINKAVSA